MDAANEKNIVVKLATALEESRAKEATAASIGFQTDGEDVIPTGLMRLVPPWFSRGLVPENKMVQDKTTTRGFVEVEEEESIWENSLASEEKAKSSTPKVSTEWNLVVVPKSEGEPSVVPEAGQGSQIRSPQEQVEPRTETGTDEAALSPERLMTVQVTSVDGEPVDLPISLDDFQALRQNPKLALKETGKEKDGPMSLLRKGGVAALGGTMVGLGLVLIPLPIPLGVVVVSSGLAVLGTEFDGAREMNEKVVSATKQGWDATRNRIIQSIEEMEGESKPTTIQEKRGETEQEGEAEAQEQKDNEESSGEQGPKVLMNDAMRKRQEEIQKQKAEAKQQQPSFMDQWRRGTGAFLATHLVPILKRDRDGSEAGSVPDADNTVQSDTETLSEIDQTEELGALEVKTSGLAHIAVVDDDDYNDSNDSNEAEDEILTQPRVSHVELSNSPSPADNVSAVVTL